MRFSAALVAGFAAAASAFLVPLEVAEDAIEDSQFKDTRFKDEHKHKSDRITLLIAEQNQVVELDCPGCPFAIPNDGFDTDATSALYFSKDVENSIHLEFSTHGHGLQLNGHTVFPFEEAQKEGLTVIKATQTRKDTGEHGGQVPISFVFEALSPVSFEKDDPNFTVLPLKVTILALNGITVKVNTVVIDLIQNAKDNAAYKIVRVRQIPFLETPGATTCEGSSRWSMCRLKAIVAARLKEIMEAAKERAHKVNGWVTGKKHGGCRKGGAYRHGHGHHSHRHHAHRIRRVFRQILRFVVIPALLGIIGGLTASALGMLVGQAIVYLWHRNYRRGQRGQITLVQQEVVLVEDEKEALLSEQPEEEPPQYQDDVEATK